MSRMKALAVRIEGPIPGKDTVGVEIPNAKRQTVYLREILDTDAFRAAPSKITLAIGKDIHGRPQVADLARMPHLLVAGATGSGKSVCINGILLSILYKATPDDVKLLLVDPKRIELSVYNDLPHLVHPVVTETAVAKSALDWAVAEMDRRYEAMQSPSNLDYLVGQGQACDHIKHIGGVTENLLLQKSEKVQAGAADENGHPGGGQRAQRVQHGAAGGGQFDTAVDEDDPPQAVAHFR